MPVTRIAYRVMYLQRQTTMEPQTAVRPFLFIDSNLKQHENTARSKKLCQNPEADLYVVVGATKYGTCFFTKRGRDPAFYLESVNKGQKSIIRCQLLLRGYSQKEKKNCRMPADILMLSVRRVMDCEVAQDEISGEWVLDPVFYFYRTMETIDGKHLKRRLSVDFTTLKEIKRVEILPKEYTPSSLEDLCQQILTRCFMPTETS